MSREVRLSVVMACHNSAAYMDDAIASVLRQTFDAWELILIDDASTDHTAQIARRYQALDRRVHVKVLTTNCGPAIARNAGFDAAKGTWLAVLDSDDVALPRRFEEQMKLANAGNEVVLIGSDAASIDAAGRVIKFHKYPTDHLSLVKRVRSRRAFPPHSSMLYRRDEFMKNHGFNPRFSPSEDCDLWLRLSDTGRIASVGQVLVHIRQHAHNISNAEGGDLQARLGMAAAVCHELRVEGLPDPSTSPDDSCWQEFIKWIDRRMQEHGEFERRRVRADARAEFFSGGQGLVGAVRFAVRLLGSGHARKVVWEKFFGSSLPRRLARGWSERPAG